MVKEFGSVGMGRSTTTAVIAGILFLQAGYAQPPSRVVERFQDGATFTLRGNTPPRARTAEDQGAVLSSFPLQEITLHLKRSDTQQQQLNQLLVDQQNSASPRYHKWLTPQQFGQQFGVNDQDLSKIRTWLEAQGFKNLVVSPSRTSIRMSGNASHVESAFHTAIHLYQAADRLHFANATDPVLPKALDGMVNSVSGLDDFHPRPHLRAVRRSADPHFTSSVSGNHFLAPGDFATIYDVQALYNLGLDGSGQKIVIAGQTDIDLSQVATFRTNAGLSANAPTVVLGGTADPGVSGTDQGEAYLDVEWAGAIAPNATIIYVNSTDVFQSLQYAVDNNLAPVISLTYGLCESQFGSTTSTESLLQQANSQGISITAAAGDTGAADCDGDADTVPAVASLGIAVDYPGTSPEVTDIGGSEFNEGSNSSTYWSSTNNSNNSSALSYIPEMVWNDSSSAGQLSASGGGVSTVFGKPSWQTGDGVPSDGARDVPDISLNASITHDEYLVCASDGTVTVGGTLQAADCVDGFRAADSTVDVVGGTSTGAPTFAAILALLNQAFGAQGNVNPRLYTLAATSTDAFHDITTGDNIVPCTQGTVDCPTVAPFQYGYAAAPGYDLASGIGSIDAQHLVEEWSQGFVISTPSPSSLSVAVNSSSTAKVQLSFLGGFSGDVTLGCAVSSALTTTTCSVPGSVSSSGQITVTITNTATARMLPPPYSKSQWLAEGGALCALGACFLFAFAVQRRSPRLKLACGGTVFLGVLLLTGCGGGSGSSSSTTTAAPAVTGTVTLTAASGSTSHSVTLSVTQD